MASCVARQVGAVVLSLRWEEWDYLYAVTYKILVVRVSDYEAEVYLWRRSISALLERCFFKVLNDLFKKSVTMKSYT